MEHFFFQGWWGLLRILVSGCCTYIVLILLLRLFGKRSLSKMSAFDFVVTVALGSILATTLVSREVSVTEGIVAFVVLLVLQFAVTWSGVRLGWVRHVVTGDPGLLYYRGEFLGGALRSARVSEPEIVAAVRKAGFADMEDVEAVVLETDGSFSVIPRKEDVQKSSLTRVRRYPG